jgi:hypothetical protein
MLSVRMTRVSEDKNSVVRSFAKGVLGVSALLALAAPAGAQDPSGAQGYSSPGAVDVYDVVETDIQLESKSTLRRTAPATAPAPAQQYYNATAEVQATPLVNSKAQSLRRARESLEVETEQKIVEKLEESRIRDEQRRSERIFGNKLDNLQDDDPAEEPKKKEPEVIYVERAPEPAPAVVPMEQESIIAQEVTISQSITPEPLAAPARAFIVADVGAAEYPDIINIQGKIASGVGLGVELPNRFVVEGRFRYSNYDLEKLSDQGESLGFRDVRQYNFGVGLNYKLLDTTFTPKVGTSLNYVTRSISEDVGKIVHDTTHSTGIDLGLMAGIDMDINQGFSMGLDFNYFTNLSTRREGESLIKPSATSHMEDFDYYILTLSGKFYF